MTEREKMISGACMTQRGSASCRAERCQGAMRQYNSLPPSAADQRDALLRGLLGSCGTHVLIEPSFFCDTASYPCGEHFYANHNLVIWTPRPSFLASMSLSPPTAAFYTAAHRF